MSQLSLAEWAYIAEIGSAISIAFGLIFGLIQVRHHRCQQRDAVATNLAQTFYSSDLGHALALLQRVPDGLGIEELEAMGPEYTEAAVVVTTSFETMGLLVYQRIAQMELVLELAGGIITVMHRKLENWHEQVRERDQQPSWAEWFHWLGDQAAKVKHSEPPAHIRHRDWTP